MHRTAPHPTTKDCAALNVINDEVGKLRFKQREEKDIPGKCAVLKERKEEVVNIRYCRKIKTSRQKLRTRARSEKVFNNMYR